MKSVITFRFTTIYEINYTTWIQHLTYIPTKTVIVNTTQWYLCITLYFNNTSLYIFGCSAGECHVSSDYFIHWQVRHIRNNDGWTWNTTTVACVESVLSWGIVIVIITREPGIIFPHAMHTVNEALEEISHCWRGSFDEQCILF